jgi:hypothetical protein
MGGARTSIATLVATIAIAIALGALGLAVASPGHPRSEAVYSASGALGLTSSRDGQTLFTAALMRPGQAVSGTLRVTNTGTTREVLALRTSGLNERAGIGGGLLSGRLALVISNVSGAGAPAQLWSGLPRELTARRSVAVRVGRAHRHRRTSTALGRGAGPVAAKALSLAITRAGPGDCHPRCLQGTFDGNDPGWRLDADRMHPRGAAPRSRPLPPVAFAVHP